MKAYVVTEPADYGSVVVFANQSVVARRIGANELDIEFEGVDTCRRITEFDRYSPGPVPPKNLVMDHGWSQFCSDCERLVSADDEDLTLVFVGGETYCSPWHRLNMAEHRANFKRRRREQTSLKSDNGDQS